VEVTFINLLLAKDVVRTYQHLSMTMELLPKKGMATWLVPPIASGYVPVKVTLSKFRGTYGEKLYCCEHCSCDERKVAR
jgi:hypothetical protein